MTPLVQMIPTHLIDMMEDELRQVREEKHLGRMEESIRKDGVKSPIWVMPQDKRFLCIAGGTRLLVAKRIGLAEIPASVTDRPLSRGEALRQMWIENELRENFTALEKKAAIQAIMMEFKCSQGEAAKMLHLSASEVSKLLSLSRLAPDLQELVQAGTLAVTAAACLTRLEDFEEQRKLAKLNIDGVFTRDALEVKVAGMTRNKPKAKKSVKVKTPGGIGLTLPAVSPSDLLAEVQSLSAALKKLMSLGLDDYSALPALMRGQ